MSPDEFIFGPVGSIYCPGKTFLFHGCVLAGEREEGGDAMIHSTYCWEGKESIYEGMGKKREGLEVS